MRRLLSSRVLQPLIMHPPRLFRCEICCGIRLMVRTDADESIGSRCLACRGTVFHRSMFKVIRSIFGHDLSRLQHRCVYEISAHGTLYRKMKRLSATIGFDFVGSEFLDGWIPGATYDGIRCENLEALTFADESFDLITSSGLMEHVENDAAAYAEIRRVLKPGGCYIFTIPYFPHWPKTIIRAHRLGDGSIQHLEEPEYHADPFRGHNVFTWRNYGADLVAILANHGLRGKVKDVDVAGFHGQFPVIIASKDA